MNPVRGQFYYVYVLMNKVGQLYTGCTFDLKKRILEHSKGMSQFTSKSGPYQLIYYEASLNKKDAFARERYLKSGMGKRYIRNRLKDFIGDL